MAKTNTHVEPHHGKTLRKRVTDTQQTDRNMWKEVRTNFPIQGYTCNDITEN